MDKPKKILARDNFVKVTDLRPVTYQHFGDEKGSTQNISLSKSQQAVLQSLAAYKNVTVSKLVLEKLKWDEIMEELKEVVKK